MSTHTTTVTKQEDKDLNQILEKFGKVEKKRTYHRKNFSVNKSNWETLVLKIPPEMAQVITTELRRKPWLSRQDFVLDTLGERVESIKKTAQHSS